MKAFVVFVVLLVGSAVANMQCDYKNPKVPKDWLDMSNKCVIKVRNHVMEELKAALQYMAMGAHFSRDKINRPGFAHLFFKAASEEREHAIKFMHYLLMRGELTSGVSDMINRNLLPNVTTWRNGVSALTDALQLEASVTKMIREIIRVCEDDPTFNDYHLVDYFTEEFLGEQYRGQRDLAGKLSTLDKMMDKHGEHKKPNIPQDWIDMGNPCVVKVRNHVMEELRAAMQYMAMGAHFSRDKINRPGFAHLFFKAASEEREHAIKLMHYLLMRGELTSGVSNMISRNLLPNTTTWTNGASALKDALQLEASVTKKIRGLIQVCEADPTFNDYHLVDYLTGDFLTEQYEGQRDLAGKLSSLEKMMDKHGALGEFLFDKKLL